jgi:DNA polymerase III subunit delta'
MSGATGQARRDAVGEDRRDAGLDAAPSLFAGVFGQDAAIGHLRIAAQRPVHAYLFVGGQGDARRELVRGFAAALLCPSGGCGHCNVCRRVLGGVHPDLVEFERAGASLSVDHLREVVKLAARRPLEARRQVIVVSEVHLAARVAPVLLKMLEEPPPTTYFLLLADFVHADLATIASRCVRVDLRAVPAVELSAWLEGRGVDSDLAADLAESAAGSVDRARVLAEDAGFAGRLALWRSVPARLDGTGSSVGALAAELVTATEEAVEPLRERHRAELEALAAAAEQIGARGVPGRKDVEDRQHRAERRWRTDELRAGLATLAAAYRDRLVAGAPQGGTGSAGGDARARELAVAVATVEEAAVELVRNPNETLMIEALLVRLSGVSG